MNFQIRKMQNEDKTKILSMMREFYSSDAVFTNGSEEIFEADFENCINSEPFLEGLYLKRRRNFRLCNDC